MYLYTIKQRQSCQPKKTKKKMTNYLNTLISEKNINIETIIEVEGQSGTNFIPLGVIVEHIEIAPTHEQNQIKNTLVKIDFHNGDIMHFFTYLAQAIAR